MRIMTFNLRFENDRDGPNGWPFRREQVARLIERHAPDVVGTQEGKWSQLLYLAEQLPGYLLHAPDRVVDDTCQYPTLFIRKEEYRVEDGGEFWLSETPDVHRSKNWDSAFPRMMSHALLSAIKSSGSFWVAVTHLDHIGAQARVEQAKILARWVASKIESVILTGDFNEQPGGAVHTVLTAEGVGLRDTWQVLGRPEDARSFTHHGFDGRPRQTRMDWILASEHFSVRDAAIIRDHEDGKYPSDHFPYRADLQMD